MIFSNSYFLILFFRFFVVYGDLPSGSAISSLNSQLFPKQWSGVKPPKNIEI